MDNNPFIHLFKTYGGFYFYDVNKNSILQIDEKVWEILKNSNNLVEICKIKSEETRIIEQLSKSGYLSNNKVKKIMHPVNEVLEDYIQNRILMINLQVTQNCNLRCKYCPYSGGYDNRKHNNKRMDLDLAKKGIDFLVEHSSDLKNIAIGFYGGEPLLEFPLIQKVITYADQKTQGKNVVYTVTTNATLLNREIIDFFSVHHVSLMISLDGPREIHNQSRQFAFNGHGSFDKVVENIQLIKDYCPDYMKFVSFNAVINPQNDVGCVCDFFKDFEIAKEVLVMYSQISNYYAKNEIKSGQMFYEKLNYEYFKYFLLVLGKLDKKYASKLLYSRFMDLHQIYQHLGRSERLPDKMHHGGPCIPGVQRLFLNVNGDFYPCEKVSETSPVVKIGNIDNGLNIDRIKEIMNIGSLTEEKCKNCWALRFCKLCVASSDDGEKLSKKLKLSRCAQTIDLIENQFKDICSLKEQGYSFNNNI